MRILLFALLTATMMAAKTDAPATLKLTPAFTAKADSVLACLDDLASLESAGDSFFTQRSSCHDQLKKLDTGAKAGPEKTMVNLLSDLYDKVDHSHASFGSSEYHGCKSRETQARTLAIRAGGLKP